MSFMLKREEIGGGRVIKGGSTLGRVGTLLTSEQLRAMKNLRPLIDAKFIHVWPLGAEPAVKKERFIVNRGFGKFDVVEGVKLNDEHLSKPEARALAGTSVVDEEEAAA